LVIGDWLNNKLYFSDEEKRIIDDYYLSGNETVSLKSLF